MKILGAAAIEADMMGKIISGAVLLAGAAACESSVIVVDPPHPTGGGGAGQGSPAVAWLERSAPLRPASAVGSGGEFPDPDALHVYVASNAISCGAPWVADCTSDVEWELDLSIQPADQHPGVIALTSPSVFAIFQWSEPKDPNPNVVGCSGGDGLGLGGTVEVVAIDAQSVTLRFSGLDAGNGAPDLASLDGGEVVVPRCN